MPGSFPRPQTPLFTRRKVRIVANHKSAEKRARQSLKRRARNRHVLSTMRTYIKQTRAAIAEGNAENAEAALSLPAVA